MYKLSFPQGGNDVNNFDPKLRLPFSSKFFFFFFDGTAIYSVVY